MRNADRGEAARLEGRELHVGIVQARFNSQITERIAVACRAELAALGVAAGAIRTVQVPGALELGVALAALAQSDEFDALIAIGCVIRGETYHFELVANESGAAVTRVSLDHDVPIANAVLTCEDEAQAAERADDKGRDAARVAVEMANLLDDWT
ncbi:MAG: 6,7-dimethyl-8-ribityllumazine synthase [Caldimonas sp.]